MRLPFIERRDPFLELHSLTFDEGALMLLGLSEFLSVITDSSPRVAENCVQETPPLASEGNLVMVLGFTFLDIRLLGAVLWDSSFNSRFFQVSLEGTDLTRL